MSEIQSETTEGIATPKSTHCHQAAPESADATASSMTEATPPENAVSGAKLDDMARQCGSGGITMSQIGLRKHLPTSTAALNEFSESWGPALEKLDAKIDKEGPWGPFANDETRQKLDANGKKLAAQILRNKPATGTEAAVCADIAERQRKGVAKYGTTVADNPLSVAQWLTHAYEEVLDLAIYLRKTIDDINENPNHISSGARMAGAFTGKLRRPRAPGSGRKPIPCPNCGAEKSIGMTTINRVPTRRCKACLHVVKQYPNLAKATT